MQQSIDIGRSQLNQHLQHDLFGLVPRGHLSDGDFEAFWHNSVRPSRLSNAFAFIFWLLSKLLAS
jgi:hypothetical protein